MDNIDTPPSPESVSPNEPATTEVERSYRRRRRFNWTILLVPLAFVLGIGSGYLLWGRNPAAAKAQPAGTEQAAGAADSQVNIPSKVKRYDVPEAGDPSIGPKNAPITIIEFSDYQCPFCKRWHDEVFHQLQAKYPDKVRIVYRNFPLSSIHPDATSAAEAAECANEQGAYWQFHDKLFSDQYGLGQDAYVKYASDLKLDVNKFTQCFTQRRYQKNVQADFDYASNLGVSSTPTFFLNGIPIVGAQPYNVFDQVITKELAGEIPR